VKRRLQFAIAILASATIGGSAFAQSKFEVASIKPCRGGDTGGRKGNLKESGPSNSPGRLTTECQTVEELIRSAYVWYATDQLNRGPTNPPLEGGPSWIRSARYQVAAKADGAPGAGVMNGKLMRALLADRFHLKIRTEAREQPVYAMTVAKEGLRLTPYQPGSCTPIDSLASDAPRPPNPCRAMIRPKGENLAVEGQGVTIEAIVKLLFLLVDRPVIDRTGLSDRYNINVEFAPEPGMAAFRPPGEPVPPAPSVEPQGPRIFEVFEKQLGLKLTPSKGAREFVVIDHVERPSGN